MEVSFVLMDAHTGSAIASFVEREPALEALVESAELQPGRAEHLVVVALEEDGTAVESWTLEDLLVA